MTALSGHRAARRDRRTGRGAGLTVNVPLPAGATGDVVAPSADEVRPPWRTLRADWVLVSAGFDAHRADPLADLGLSSGDFADLASIVRGFTPSPGRLAFFLEGGYDFDALRESVAATLAAVTGAEHAAEPATAGGPGIESVARAHAIHAEPREHELW